METVLFTDHAVVVFAVITGALALIFFFRSSDLQQRARHVLTSNAN